MVSLIKKLGLKREASPEAPSPVNNPQRKKTVPPYVAVCRVCSGVGSRDSGTCPQCQGTGRVIVSHEITTFITAYVAPTQ